MYTGQAVWLWRYCEASGCFARRGRPPRARPGVNQEWDHGDQQPGAPEQAPLCKRLLPLVSSLPTSQVWRRRIFLFPAAGLERKSVSPELRRKEHSPLCPAHVQQRRKSKQKHQTRGTSQNRASLGTLAAAEKASLSEKWGSRGVGSPIPDGHWAILLEKVLLPSKVSHK